MRNRVYKVTILLMGSLLLIHSIGAWRISKKAGLLALGIGILIVGLEIWANRKRYQEIQALSAYLYRICEGEYTLDIRDNEEGELSILKNEIYKMSVRMAEQAELLKKDKRYLADAISDISHQLKTPLTSMMVMTELLEDHNLAQEKRILFTRKIKKQLERIEWLVSSLLKLSKIDAGTVQFKKERVSVKDLVTSSVEPLLIPMELKEQELVVSGAESYFIGDLNWSREAFVNIIKNCVEHTQIGGEIHVNYVENPLYTEVCIVDNGEGIDQKDLPNIFKRFYKGSNADSESVGIGLAMARSIILAQNGDIKVESEKGKGTTFKVRFYKEII